MIMNFFIIQPEKRNSSWIFKSGEGREKLMNFLLMKSKCHEQADKFLIKYGMASRLVS